MATPQQALHRQAVSPEAAALVARTPAVITP